VPSYSDDRAVGCVGGEGAAEHDLVWHVVKKNKPLICMECGQAFRLIAIDEWLDWAATEHAKGAAIVEWWGDQ